MSDAAAREKRNVGYREAYAGWASVYDSDGNPLTILDTLWVPTLIGSVHGKRVLDLGCGTGRHCVQMARSGALVTALDGSPEMLAMARQKAEGTLITFVEHDITRPLPFGDASFDLVLSTLVIEHITDLRALFREMRRVISPYGALVVSDIHPVMRFRGTSAHYHDATGVAVHPPSIARDVSDYVNDAVAERLIVERMLERRVDADLVARAPRAQKYLDVPMLFAMRLSRR